MTLTASAPAKINLTLDILQRRPDGYHDIRSVMQAVSLRDTITVEESPDEEIVILGGSPDAPPNEANLVYRAAAALSEAVGGGRGARLALKKRVPVGAGLGGGSSDAAATLLALDRLWKTRLTTERLIEIAAGLGSDVPFFLTGGTALAEGRGEVLTALPAPEALWLAIVYPMAPLSTPSVYHRFSSERVAGAAEPNASETMISALRSNSLGQICACLHNDLQAVAFKMCPTARFVRDLLMEAGAMAALLSGSGSAVFGIARDEAHAVALADSMRPRGYWAAAAHTVALPFEEPQ